MTAKFGIHCPNYPNLTGDDLDAIAALNPSLMVVCQPDFGTIPEIRRRMPGITIVGRVFGDYAANWDAWHLPWNDENRMAEYGRFCAQLSAQFEISVIQYANEPGIDDGDPSWWTVEGYQKLARGCDAVRRGFWTNAPLTAKLGTVPLSPGHQEDDGLTGAQYLAEVWHRHDVLLLHTYWNRNPESVTEEWFGGRWKRQLDAYGWTGPWAITEWNRDEPTPPGDEERRTLAGDARRWFAAFPPDLNFLGAAFFIWRTGAPEFNRLQQFNNEQLNAVARDVNAQEQQGGSTMPKKTVITPQNRPSGAPGTPVVFLFEAKGVDGIAKGFSDVTMALLPGSTESRYGPNQTTELLAFRDGVNSATILLPPATTPIPPGGVEAEIRFRLFELDGTEWDGGIFGPWPADVTEGEAPPIPGAPPTAADMVNAAREVVFNTAGDGYNADGNPIWLDIQRAVDAMKEGKDFRSAPKK